MDAELEALIDRAGRQRVFDHMQANGWTELSAPPKHIWQSACHEIITGKDKEQSNGK